MPKDGAKERSTSMTKPVARQRRARGSIDPDQILDGAFAVSERVGLDRLSMPELAAHLDVGVTSIYWYFRNKEDLLRRMTSRAIASLHAELTGPDGRPPAEWCSYLREFFTDQRRLYLEDGLRLDLILMRTGTYTTSSTHIVYQLIEDTVAYLVNAGFTLRTAWYVYSTLSIYSRGFVIAERNREMNGTPPSGDLQLDLLDARTMPLLSRLVVEEPMFIDMTGDQSFEFGLGTLLEEAERLLQRDRQSAD